MMMRILRNWGWPLWPPSVFLSDSTHSTQMTNALVPFSHRMPSSRQQEPHCESKRKRRARERPTGIGEKYNWNMCSDLGQGSRICAFYSFTGILFTVSYRFGDVSRRVRSYRRFEGNGRCNFPGGRPMCADWFTRWSINRALPRPLKGWGRSLLAGNSRLIGGERPASSVRLGIIRASRYRHIMRCLRTGPTWSLLREGYREKESAPDHHIALALKTIHVP